MISKIKYKRRRYWKYKLHADVVYDTGILGFDGGSDMLHISSDGMLHIKTGYAWDGPSGPAIDTKNFMPGSLVHDALYQLIREEILPMSYRKKADQILRVICRAKGMTKIRAWWVYRGVRIGGKGSAMPDMLEA